MKRHLILSLLAAVAILLVSTSSAEAGMFGRLHVFKGGCAPCEPVACEPCKPVCEPCKPVCEPCDPCCDNGCRGPVRPFGGFFSGLKSKLAVKHCSPCEPCEPCQPCEKICKSCEPSCCEPACGDCCGHAPLRPFKGFFANAWARWQTRGCNSCGCEPCEPVCEPCTKCCK
jgi:hypothetical protein